MKACTRFHIEDVEPGDVITLYRYDGEKSVTITVRRTFETNRFGWGIDTTDSDCYYWNDWDSASIQTIRKN